MTWPGQSCTIEITAFERQARSSSTCEKTTTASPSPGFSKRANTPRIRGDDGRNGTGMMKSSAAR